MPRSILQRQIKKRRPFDSLQEEAYLNLFRTHSQLSAAVDQLFKWHDTSDAQYNVLRILRGAKSGGEPALPCLEIADRMITRLPDITRLIDRLESAGLVERQRTKRDRRVILVAITAEGLNLLRKLDQPLTQLHKQQLGHLSRSELDQLNRLLVKARQSSLTE